MRFRLDFSDKLDLTRFKRQAPHYIKNMPEVNYCFMLPEYRMDVQIVRLDSAAPKHNITISIFELKRAKDGTIQTEQVIVPMLDSRFQELEDIKSIFGVDHFKATFDSASPNGVVDKICNLVKIIHKINRLKAFL